MLPQTAVFAITNYKPLKYTHALWAGERFRTILMGISSKHYGSDGIPRIISGRNIDGSALRESHAHISYLSVPNTIEGSISHMILYSPLGFDSEAQIVLMMFRRFWINSNRDYSVKLLGFLDVDSTSKLLSDKPGILVSATEWESITPFILNRHLHLRNSRMKNSSLRHHEFERVLIEEVKRELEFRHFPVPEKVSLFSADGVSLNNHFISWSAFKRIRLKGIENQIDTHGYGFRITFSKPVRGPINLGYGCHYGLGLFRAVSE